MRTVVCEDQDGLEAAKFGFVLLSLFQIHPIKLQRSVSSQTPLKEKHLNHKSTHFSLPAKLNQPATSEGHRLPRSDG